MSTTTITVIERAKVEQINREHQLCHRAGEEAVVHAVACGRMLAAVKADLSHGEWGPWLDDHFDASRDTAQLYMRMAANPERIPLFAGVGDAKQQLAKPRQPSTGEVTSLLRGMGSTPSTTRLDDARDRLRSEASITFSEQQERKKGRALDLLAEAAVKTNTAATGSLSKFGIAELLREAAIEAQHAASALNDLAFTFER